MKTLCESILGSNRTGIKQIITNWLLNNRIFTDESRFDIINSIIYPKENTSVTLFAGDMCELPEYIQFGDGEYTLRLGVTNYSTYNPPQTKVDIRSFRGLPNRVKNLFIEFPSMLHIPSLDIEVSNKCAVYSSCHMDGKLNIKYAGKSQDIKPTIKNHRDLVVNLDLGGLNEKEFRNMSFKDFDVINLYNTYPFEISNKLTKLLTKTAPYNKIGKWSEPIDEKLYDQIENFFRDQFKLDIQNYRLISYNGACMIVKYNDKWYRAENIIEK
jgi:hypothetical protein